MKKVILIFVSIVLLSGCILCPSKNKILEGKHSLRKMFENVKNESKTTGYFLFGFGSVSSSSQQIPIIRFAWKENGSNTYIISEVPLNNVRVTLDSTVVIPTVEFKQNCGYPHQDDIQDMIENKVKYVTIYVTPEDWPQDINLPLQKNEAPTPQQD